MSVAIFRIYCNEIFLLYKPIASEFITTTCNNFFAVAITPYCNDFVVIATIFSVVIDLFSCSDFLSLLSPLPFQKLLDIFGVQRRWTPFSHIYVNSIMNLNCKSYHKYEKREHHFTAFQKYLRITLQNLHFLIFFSTSWWDFNKNSRITYIATTISIINNWQKVVSTYQNNKKLIIICHVK